MMTLIHRLRRHLSERQISSAPTLRQTSPDRFFTSRLQAGGAAAAPSPEGLGGYLGPEPQVKIPFRLAAGDGEVKVVVFSDPPGLLSLAVEKPDGTRLAAADVEYGAEWSREGATETCSFTLPAGESRSGTWRVVLAVDTSRFKGYLMSLRGRFPREFERLAARGLFYSVSALAARRPAAPPSPSPQPRMPRHPSRPPRSSSWATAHLALGSLQ